MDRTHEPIIVKQLFKVSVETVWNAITNVVEMRQWFFDNIPDFKADIGFETQFNVKSEVRNFMHQWRIIDVKVNKKITYNWSYADYPGNGIVTFEIFKSAGIAKLVVTSLGMDSFPQDIPEFKRESCIAGWTYFIKQNLKSYLG